jgi:hypothetical protein
MKSRTVLVFAGFLLFVLSLLLPAIYLKGGAGTLSGFACALIGFGIMPGILRSITDGIEMYPLYVGVLGLCNVMMIFAAVSLALNKGARIVKVGLPIAALLVCGGRVILPLTDSEGGMKFFAGYYVWALSFVLLAVAVNRE